MSVAAQDAGSKNRGEEMKTILRFVIVTLLFSSLLTAGEVYGLIKDGGRPIDGGTPVVLRCGVGVDSGVTDKYGSYSLSLPASGKCTLTVYYRGRAVSVEVFLYSKPVRFDLTMDQEKGKQLLRRDLSGLQRKR